MPPNLKLNSPIPVNLGEECKKATKIMSSFVDSKNNGLDKVIPRQILENAKGFAIFTVFKAGFLVSARAGSGVVIAKLPDGTWSAPSAIGTAGLGFGGQAGAEVTDFLIVLNSRSAVSSFMSAGSLTLGGNMSLAVGPLGRNAEGMGVASARGTTAMYSYSKTKGLFGGVSVEGSVIVERQDANRIAFGRDVTSKALLTGAVPVPHFALGLVNQIESAVGLPGGQTWINDDDFRRNAEEEFPASPSRSSPGPLPTGQYGFQGYGSGGKDPNPSNRSRSGSLLGRVGRSGSVSSLSRPSTPGSPGGLLTGSLGYGKKKKQAATPSDFHEDDYFGSSAGYIAGDPTYDNDRHSPMKNSFNTRNGSSASEDPFSSTFSSTGSPGVGKSPSFPTHFESDFDAPASSKSGFDELLPFDQASENTFSQQSHKYPITSAAMGRGPSWSIHEERDDVHDSNHLPKTSTSSFAFDDFSSHLPPAAAPKPSRSRSGSLLRMMTSSPKNSPKKERPSSSYFHEPSHEIPENTNEWGTTKDISDLQDKIRRNTLSSQMKRVGSHNSSPDSAPVSSTPAQYIPPKAGLSEPLTEGIGRGIALFDFAGVEEGDLSFKMGDVVIILQKSKSTADWWTGRVGNSKEGIFPANYLELV